MSELDYFYGRESEQFSFFRIPKILHKSERYKDVGIESKFLYGLMLDRMELSRAYGWIDGQNRVYIIYTNENIQEDMNCGHEKAVKLVSNLKKAGLIEVVKQGQGKPAIIYVKNFVASGEKEKGVRKEVDAEVKNSENQKSDLETSENQKSGLPKIRSLDFRKSECNYTNNNNTDFNDTNSIHPSNPYGESCQLSEDISEDISSSPTEQPLVRTDGRKDSEELNLDGDVQQSPEWDVFEKMCSFSPNRNLLNTKESKELTFSSFEKLLDTGISADVVGKRWRLRIEECLQEGRESKFCPQLKKWLDEQLFLLEQGQKYKSEIAERKDDMRVKLKINDAVNCEIQRIQDKVFCGEERSDDEKLLVMYWKHELDESDRDSIHDGRELLKEFLREKGLLSDAVRLKFV